MRVTHRFHPLSGQSFEFVKRLQAWQSDLVYFLDPAGELTSVPAVWTDLVAPDPFVVVAAGRAAFRAGDLAELAELVSRCRVLSTGLCHECPSDYVRPAVSHPAVQRFPAGVPGDRAGVSGFIALGAVPRARSV